MRSARTTLVTAGCALLLATYVGADPTSEARKAIAALYVKTAVAYSRKDFDGADAYDTADSITIDTKGKRFTLAQQRQMVQRVLPLIQDMKETYTIQKIRLSGKTSLVTVSGYNSMMLVNPRTHVANTLVISDVQRDTWIKTPQGWRRRL